MTTKMKLNFSSYIDLQTRLQLVPFNDEECVGAKVLDILNDTSDIHDATIIRVSQKEDDDNNNDNEEDWREEDFGSILSRIREMNNDGPLVVFIELSMNNNNNTNNDDTKAAAADDDPNSDTKNNNNTHSSSVFTTTLEEEDGEGKNSSLISLRSATNTSAGTENIASQVIKRGLLNWGSSISKHAEYIKSAAVEAAVTVTSTSNNNNNNIKSATVTSVVIPSLDADTTGMCSSNNDIKRSCDIYIQDSNGKFAALNDSSTSTKAASFHSPKKSPARSINSRSSSNTNNSITITNSSFLQVRVSEDKPCPTFYKFQWYRSSSSSSSWFPIVGATVPSYQPSAIDVGKYLKCIVLNNSTQDEDNHETIIENLNTAEKNIKAITSNVDLFNAARQNFINGGSIFNNLQGRGKASGREFRIKIKVGSSSSSATTCSQVWIYQVYGGTAESLVPNDTPIQGVTAIVDALHPKHFDLIFSSMVEDGMVKALVTEKDNLITLPLIAPNRVSRESFLLALGIANFTGKPSELTSSSLLYTDTTNYHYNANSIHVSNTNNNDTNKNDATSTLDYSCYSPPRSMPHKLTINGGEEVSFGKVEVFVTSPSQPINDGDNNISNIPSSLVSPNSTSIDNRIKKIQTMESEISKLNTILTAKRDFTLSVQAQLKLMEDEIHKKDLEIEMLQQDILSIKRKNQETCDILTCTQKQMQKHDSILLATKQEYSERITLLNEKTAEYKERYEEYEGIIKLLENDKRILSAKLNARDVKLAQMEELYESNILLRKEVESKKDLEEELNNVCASNLDLNDKVNELEQSNQNLKQELEPTQLTLTETKMQFQDAQLSIATLESMVRTLEGQNHNLCMQRNSYRQKSDSLSKEISKIYRYGLDVKKIEHLMQESNRMRTQIRELENERRYEKAELERLRENYEEILESQVSSRLQVSASAHQPAVLLNTNNSHGSGSRMMPATANAAALVIDSSLGIEHKSDLERVISNLTEYLNAKEFQLETMTQVNRSLIEEVQVLTEKLQNR